MLPMPLLLLLLLLLRTAALLCPAAAAARMWCQPFAPHRAATRTWPTRRFGTPPLRVQRLLLLLRQRSQTPRLRSTAATSLCLRPACRAARPSFPACRRRLRSALLRLLLRRARTLL